MKRLQILGVAFLAFLLSAFLFFFIQGKIVLGQVKSPISATNADFVKSYPLNVPNNTIFLKFPTLIQVVGSDVQRTVGLLKINSSPVDQKSILFAIGSDYQTTLGLVRPSFIQDPPTSTPPPPATNTPIVPTLTPKPTNTPIPDTATPVPVTPTLTPITPSKATANPTASSQSSISLPTITIAPTRVITPALDGDNTKMTSTGTRYLPYTLFSLILAIFAGVFLARKKLSLKIIMIGVLAIFFFVLGASILINILLFGSFNLNDSNVLVGISSLIVGVLSVLITLITSQKEK